VGKRISTALRRTPAKTRQLLAFWSVAARVHRPRPTTFRIGSGSKGKFTRRFSHCARNPVPAYPRHTRQNTEQKRRARLRKLEILHHPVVGASFHIVNAQITAVRRRNAKGSIIVSSQRLGVAQQIHVEDLHAVLGAIGEIEGHSIRGPRQIHHIPCP